MPVTVALFYREYAIQLKRGDLVLAGRTCPRCSSPDGPRLVLTSTRFTRPVFFLERDDYGCLEIVLRDILLAQARCKTCGARLRVLPADILPRKPYSLPVIEHLLVLHRDGGESLRRTIALLGGEGHWPSPSTLHAWLDGFGAYALGRPGGEVAGSLPASAIRTELEQRRRRARKPDRDRRTTELAAARCKTDARRERLRAASAFLFACAVIGTEHPEVLSQVTVLLLGWGGRDGIGFRSGLRCTSLEHPGSPHARSSSDTPKKRGGRGGFT
jgi:hypothetical protein